MTFKFISLQIQKPTTAKYDSKILPVPPYSGKFFKVKYEYKILHYKHLNAFHWEIKYIFGNVFDNQEERYKYCSL